MTSDLKKINVIDPRLEVLSQLDYAIKRGPMQNNYLSFSAQNENNNNNIFINCILPSVRTLINRTALIESTIVLRIDVPSVGNPLRRPNPNEIELSTSNFESFGPFPFHASINNLQLDANGNKLTLNMQELLPIFLATISEEELLRYTGCPISRDKYFNYSDAFLSMSDNVLNAYSVTNKIKNRGSNPVTITAHYSNGTTGIYDPTNNDPAFAINYLTVSINTIEPLLMYPFFPFASHLNQQSIYNLENINFNFNMDNTAKRAYRVGTKIYNGNAFVDRQYNYTYSIEKFENTKITFNTITPHNNLILPERMVVPYKRYDYFTYNIGSIQAGTTQTITNSEAVQMNTIPHKLYVWIRPENQTVYTSDCYLTINSINLNYNGTSGILSSATQLDLYNICKNNGSQQSYEEFIGKKSTFMNRQYPYTSNTALNVPTAGSILILEFGTDIEIVSPAYVPGSQVDTNLLITMSVSNNQTDRDPIGINYPLRTNPANYAGLTGNDRFVMVIMTEYEGIMALEKGMCETYNSIVQVSDVLNTKNTMPIHTEILI